MPPTGRPGSTATPNRTGTPSATGSFLVGFTPSVQAHVSLDKAAGTSPANRRVRYRPAARMWTMPNLLDELERYLHRWRDDLPTAWRERLDGAAPDFHAIPRDAWLGQDARIVPVRPRNRSGVFYALEGIDPSDVAVVVIGNDPYPDPHRATGRSFEQGDLAEWIDDLAEPGRVTPSLLSLLCAAAALLPDAEGLRLDSGGLRDRRGVLRRGLQDGQLVLPPPRSLFENLTGQGVLWINRTPTTSVTDAGRRLRGSSWEAVEEQRGRHRRLWRPVTRHIVSVAGRGSAGESHRLRAVRQSGHGAPEMDRRSREPSGRFE